METQQVATITEDAAAHNQISHDFYIVGPLKFAILFFFTFGVYMAYWFYRNWKQQKAVTKEDCWPIMRGVFLIFFTHDLLSRIDKKLRVTDKKYDWSSQVIATLIVCFVLTARILDRLSSQNIGSPYTGIGALLMLAIIALLLIYVQRVINFACNDPEGESNNQLTGLNFLWIAIGSIFIALATIGIFFSPNT